MWGTDPILRKPLSGSTTATTIVFGEHVVLVVLTLPLLLPALRALVKAGPRYIAAGIAIGAGASAVATILFTEALFHGDFVTPVVIQKIQPLVAVLGAAIVLGERPRPRFAWFLLPALLGFWLVNQAHPLAPTPKGLIPITQATPPAARWAPGAGLAVIAGIYAYNSDLRWPQWLGVVTIVATVSLLPVQRRRKMVALPAPAPSPA